MGKGNGDHPPQKFIGDQCFCQLFVFIFMGSSVTLSTLSAGMDDGGNFVFPYFITGFILGPILFVNLVSRWYVVKAVIKKGVTRNNIIEILNTTTCGKHIWPWSCRVGMLWCIPGSIITGLGGINCGIEGGKEKITLLNDTSTVQNTCYYDIQGENGDMYQGLAIGLVVIHVSSFVYLACSNCPVNSVLNQIKEDPVGNRVTRPTAAATSTGGRNNTEASSTGEASNAMEMKTKIQILQARVRELECIEIQIGELSVLPPPPSYNELMHSSTCTSTGAHPETTIP